MKNTKLFLLIGTSMSLIPTITFAQCVATQDCATLGYTESSCAGGNGVKCPFGNKWACFKTDTEVCKQYGFTQTCTGIGQIGSGENCANLYKQCGCQDPYKYTCSGEGYSGGSGAACDGKYTQCECAEGYEWANEKCRRICSSCGFGCLYYSDDTCSADYDSSKTLLGIVVYEKTASQNGWVMTHKPIATDVYSGRYGDITSNITGTAASSSCANTQKLVALGSFYQDAIAANNYTAGGKKWCLPAYDILSNLNDQTKVDMFNETIKEIQSKAGTNAATLMGDGDDSHSYEDIYSSSVGKESYDDYYYRWYLFVDNDEDTLRKLYLGLTGSHPYGHRFVSVRPVMAF